MAHIALNECGNTGLATVTLNADHIPFVFLLDTGSNRSHINCRAADLLAHAKRERIDEENVGGISGSTKSFEKLTQTFHAGIFAFQHEFMVTDYSELIDLIKEESGLEIHGTLGMDFFRKYRCHLDFKKNRLHLS